ncbi:Origin recognition complex subunit 6, partial [Operophtera brumata]
EVDLNLPQYVCMAVCHACRINKIKVSKSKFVEKSRLKPAQWTKLDADWTKFPYEDWKRRMLEAAYIELRELEEKEKCKPKRLESHRDSLTPRRSPRKTPQKFSPYKSPAKINGVRLLFQ